MTEESSEAARQLAAKRKNPYLGFKDPEKARKAGKKSGQARRKKRKADE